MVRKRPHPRVPDGPPPRRPVVYDHESRGVTYPSGLVDEEGEFVDDEGDIPDPRPRRNQSPYQSDRLR